MARRVSASASVRSTTSTGTICSGSRLRRRCPSIRTSESPWRRASKASAYPMSRRSALRADRCRSGCRRQFAGCGARSPARTRTSSTTRSRIRRRPLREGLVAALIGSVDIAILLPDCKGQMCGPHACASSRTVSLRAQLGAPPASARGDGPHRPPCGAPTIPRGQACFWPRRPASAGAAP